MPRILPLAFAGLGQHRPLFPSVKCASARTDLGLFRDFLAAGGVGISVGDRGGFGFQFRRGKNRRLRTTPAQRRCPTTGSRHQIGQGRHHSRLGPGLGTGVERSWVGQGPVRCLQGRAPQSRPGTRRANLHADHPSGRACRFPLPPSRPGSSHFAVHLTAFVTSIGVNAGINRSQEEQLGSKLDG